MSDLSTHLPAEQQAIRAKCFHPSGSFIEFKKEEIEQSIPDRFEKILAKYPDRIAVKTKSRTLSYRKLNRLSNRVARAILAVRGEAQEPVALLLDHDAPMIAAILGVLKTGKIYVPLDPLHPQARITCMLEELQAGLIVTDNKNLSVAEGWIHGALQLINIDKLDAALSTENVDLALTPDTLAYILYTSGSTGQPKGVLQNHRNVLHRVKSDTNVFHLCTDDHLSLLSSCTSNASVGDIFGALLNGATLCPFSLKEEGLVNLVNWLIQEEITIYHSVPTLFRHVCGTLTGAEQFPTLRLVCLGGEPVYKREVELYKKHFSPNCIFFNLLGITETHNIAVYVIDKDTQIEGSLMPAGYALEDMGMLLLGDDGEEVGSKQVGEIAVKSRYLCPGYWRKPDLSRSAFLPDPEGGEERIYRTGDLGLMLEDGCLVHMGRKDFQVKVSGHRVEVAEIEEALLSLGKIKEAIVTVREVRPGDQRLVAYIVPAEKPALTVTTLRHALAEKLPDYMVPSAFMILDALPLLPNGKVDRRSLPVPAATRPNLEISFVAPRTPVEETLVRIWAELLGLDQVGIHDNFFELGGHSLLATQVISRVRSALRIELPLRSLFEKPTIAELALTITHSRGETARAKEIDRILAGIESLSDEEAQQLLSNKGENREKESP